MAMNGFLFLYNNPVTRQLDYVCANMGPSPGIMTHNVFQPILFTEGYLDFLVGA